jgi:succinate dehydrogenase / fumarate reductase cytochrome b subunit
MARVTGGVFVVGEFLVFMAFAFHAANGVRLVLVELGWAIGNPIEPVYPYRTSVHEQRPLAIGVMVLAGLIVLAGGLDFFILH